MAIKLTVSKEKILQGLQRVQSIVNPRNTLPILSNVLLKAEGDKVWLTTTDLEITIQTAVEAQITKAGSTTLPARRIFSIFRELPSDEIELLVDGNDVTEVRCGSSYFKIMGLSHEDFPQLPVFDSGRSYSIAPEAFKEMLAQTSYAASTDETRYMLNGVLLSFKGDKLTIVATDGRRLALVEQELEFPKESEANLILPSKTVHELIRSLPDDGELKIRATDNQIAFEFNNQLVISKLIEGNFPNYRQVIPGQSEHRVALVREELLNAVRRVALLTSDASNSVKLTFGKNKLEVVTITPDIGEARESLPIKYSEKETTIAFNPQFIMDPLKTLASDEIFFEFTDDLSPGVVKSNIPFTYVIMPMRLT